MASEDDDRVDRWRVPEVDGLAEEGGRTRLRHLTEGAELKVEDGRLRRGAGYADASRGARRALARVGAMVRLRQLGRYLVHASGVVDPRGRAWIFAGRSGSGKSTLAYALARSGWQVLGDDGVLIERDGEELVARAWRDPLLVSSRLAAHFPEIGAGPECEIPGDARQRLPVRAPAARAAPVAALLLVRHTPRDEITRLPAAQALASLIRLSPWVALDDAFARDHFAAMQQLARSVPVFSFEHSERQLRLVSQTLSELLP
ncbi:MAG: hypothetical protein ACREON_17285 [Gemmatimonadaceae bacterium]